MTPALAFALFIASGPASAADGVFEINQVCASVGCFAGDAPGFPVTIDRDEPASYRLTSTLLIGDPNVAAIEIRDDHVTLDLGGFAITGPTACSGSGSGLVCTPVGSGTGHGIAVVPDTRSGVAVSNGIVRGMGNKGIVLGPESRVEDVLVVSNASAGIEIIGARSRVVGSRVMRNGGSGIFVDAGAVERSTVAGNRQTGVVAINGSVVSGNLIQGNGSNAIDSVSFLSSGGTLIVDNSVTDNGAQAFFASSDGYARNVFRANGVGVPVGGGTQIGANLCGGALCP